MNEIVAKHDISQTSFECMIVRKVERISDLQNSGAKCAVCGELLDIGDYLDNNYPYYDSNNHCEKCWSKRKKQIKSTTRH